MLENGNLVARRSDFTVFSVEAVNLDKVVAEYGPCASTVGMMLMYSV